MPFSVLGYAICVRVGNAYTLLPYYTVGFLLEAKPTTSLK